MINFLRIKIILMSLFLLMNGAPDNRGREFIIGFMENSPNYEEEKNLQLFITTNIQRIVNVSVTAPKYSAQLIDEHVNVTSGQVQKLSFGGRLRVTGTRKDTKAIHILADDEIVIYCVNREETTNDAFLGLPLDVLSKQYYTVSWSSSAKQSEILLLGVNDSTTVNIHLPRGLSPAHVTWKNVVYLAGDVIIETLNRFDTFQIQAHGDLTGTYIVSNKLIGVISGNVRTDVGSGTTSDHLTEMIPPVDTFGKMFATVPIPDRTVGDYFKFIASENDTLISIRGGHVEDISIQFAGDHALRLISSSAYCVVNSSKPLLVAQFSQSEQNDESDPAMMIIPPVELFSSHYTFSTPRHSSGSYKNYFMFAIKDADKYGLTLDGNLVNTTFHTIVNTEYVGGYIKVGDGTHIIQHSSSIKIFGGYLYGRTFVETYALPIGMRLAPINVECNASHTVVGDGIDNDCDGRIDEEICETDDELDDDNDGQIDEDCAKPSPVNGNWGAWSGWNACSMTCLYKNEVFNGSRTRQRECSNPAANYGGFDCKGDPTETEPCNSSIPCQECSCFCLPSLNVIDAINYSKYDFLKIDKKNTTRQRLSKTSVYETRPSAVAIGGTAMTVLLILFFAIFIIPDVPVVILTIWNGTQRSNKK